MDGRALAVSDFEYKQVIVFRTNLRLSKGKTAVQAGHAAVSAAENARNHRPIWWKGWIEEGQAKIVVKVKDEIQLFDLKSRADEMKLPIALIVDRGLTEIPPDTITCLGIGPAPSNTVNKLTGNLPLL